MPRKGYNTKFKMSAKELGVLTVAAGKAGMIPIDYLLKKKLAEKEIKKKADGEINGKRKRSDSVETSAPTPKKLDGRDSPTIVLKKWIEEGYNIGWPDLPEDAELPNVEEFYDPNELPSHDRKLNIHGNSDALECHGCGHHARTLRHLMWYDTGGDGTQLCGSCDMIFYDEYIKHRASNK
ncbi:MAG: hypothetical protein CMO44_15950 [Verrucomicrobiales bacterium]|nr:hypothetical protein [Verrucomicrobiales bacterium]